MKQEGTSQDKSKTPPTLAGLLFVEVCRSPEYTAPAPVSAGDALHDGGVRARHRLCGRDSVFLIKMSDMQEKTRAECQSHFFCPITSPIDYPCTQRYRGNGTSHLSATDTTLRKVTYIPHEEWRTYGEMRVDTGIR